MAYTLISEQVLASATATVTFSSIPGTYKDLFIEIAGTSSAQANLTIGFNGDTGTNYSRLYMQGDSVTRSGSNSNVNVLYGMAIYTTPAMNTAHIQSYANTNVYKSTLIRSSKAVSAGTAGADGAAVSMWRSTAAITSIAISPDGGNTLSIGTTLRLWGIA